MTGKELLEYLQGLSEEDLSKDIVLEENGYDNIYEPFAFGIEDSIVISMSQVFD